MSRVKLSVGVWDALSALLAERAGFELLFLSGFAVAGTRLGEPDFGLLTQTEMLETARRVIGAVKVPVIVDGDTGHGGPLNVQRLVRELVALGAGGVLLEDQVWPKRCGHMRGKEVIAAEAHVQKIRAAVDARGEREAHLDRPHRRARAARARRGDPPRAPVPRGGRRRDLRRSAPVARRAGADRPRSAGPADGEHGRGRQPRPSCRSDELRALGYEYVVYPLTGLLSAARALERAFRELAAKGTSARDAESRMSFDEFTSSSGLVEKYAAAERYKS